MITDPGTTQMKTYRFLPAAAVFSLLAFQTATALAQDTAPQLPASLASEIMNARDVDTCVSITMNAINADNALLEAATQFATGRCPEGTAAILSDALARKFPDQLEDIAVWMTQARPAAVGEIVLSIVATVPEDRRISTFEAIIARLKKDVPGIDQNEAFAAIPGIGELSGPAFDPFLFPRTPQEVGPVNVPGPGPGASPS